MKRLAVLIVLITFIFLIGAVSAFYRSSIVSAQEQAAYTGIDKCKLCHPAQIKDFETRKFSKSWSVLEMRGKTKDPECLKCHTTGFSQPTGYVSEEATPHLKYKQCEACHGPGSIHAGNPADKEAREGMKNYAHHPSLCTDCHKGVKAHRIGVKGF